MYYDYTAANWQQSPSYRPAKAPWEKREEDAVAKKTKKVQTEAPKEKKRREEEEDDFLAGFRQYENEEKEQLEKFAKIRANADKRAGVADKVLKEAEKQNDDFLAGLNEYKEEEKEEIKKLEKANAPYVVAKPLTPAEKVRRVMIDAGVSKAKSTGLLAETEINDDLILGFNRDDRNFAEQEKIYITDETLQKDGKGASAKKALDVASNILTVASFIPGLDTFTNLVQIPVDLLRGDFVGAGLDLVGAIPFVGEIADAAKTAKSVGRIVDGAQAAKAMNGVVDGAKAAKTFEDAVDVAKSSNVLIDTVKAVDAAGTTLNTAGNVGELAKAYPKGQIPDEVKGYLSELVQEGQGIQVYSPPSLEQISLMSRQEAVEFASISVGGRNYIIRGNIKGTTIPQDMLDDMIQNKGILNCHSHPYIGDFRPSDSDLRLAEILNHQKEFRIVTPDGLQAIYTKDGIKFVGNIEKKLAQDDIRELYELFGG